MNEFDKVVETKDGQRFYCSNNKRYPSVTTAINILRRPDLEMLRGMIGNKKADDAMNKGGVKGTLIHEICEQILKGVDIGPLVLAPAEQSRIDEFTKWKNEFVEEVIDTEIEGINERYGYGYRADVLLRFKGSPALVCADLKTGALNKTARLQTAAYAKALNAKRRGVIHLPNEGPVKYIPYDNLDLDFNAFICCLNLCNWSHRY